MQPAIHSNPNLTVRESENEAKRVGSRQSHTYTKHHTQLAVIWASTFLVLTEKKARQISKLLGYTVDTKHWSILRRLKQHFEEWSPEAQEFYCWQDSRQRKRRILFDVVCHRVYHCTMTQSLQFRLWSNKRDELLALILHNGSFIWHILGPTISYTVCWIVGVTEIFYKIILLLQDSQKIIGHVMNANMVKRL